MFVKADLYTKAVLTVIAACLVLLALRDYAAPARADGPVEVKVVGIRAGYPWDAVKVQQGR